MKKSYYLSPTMEDILEELVGNIFDEYDDEETEIRKIDDNTYMIEGSATLYEINRLFNVEIPEGDYETLSGYLLDLLGRIPEENIVVEDENLTYKVEEIDDKRIRYVKVCRNMNKQKNADEENVKEEE